MEIKPRLFTSPLAETREKVGAHIMYIIRVLVRKKDIGIIHVISLQFILLSYKTFSFTM